MCICDVPHAWAPVAALKQQNCTGLGTNIVRRGTKASQASSCLWVCPDHCAASVQVSYVLDTEDVFRRLKRVVLGMPQDVVEAKSAKFRRCANAWTSFAEWSNVAPHSAITWGSIDSMVRVKYWA